MERSNIFTAVLIALLIFQAVLLYVIVVAENSAVAEKWSYSTNGSIVNLRSLYLGADGTAYLLNGRSMLAIDGYGQQKWKAAVPELNASDQGSTPYIIRSTTSIDGYLYSYLCLDNWTPDGYEGELVAISPDGRVLWSKRCEKAKFGSVAVSGDTIYLTTAPVINDETLTAFDTEGNIKWSKRGIFSNPVFDDAGNAYLVEGNRIPIYSDTLQAYSPEGTRLWSRSLSEQGVNGPGGLTFHNGSLYLETYGVKGVACIDKNGTVQWKQEYPEMTSFQITFDQDNNIYVIDYSNAKVFSQDGILIADYGFDLLSSYRDYAGLNNGILYVSKFDYSSKDHGLNDMPGVSLIAFDLKNNRQVWSYEIKPKPAQEVTIEPDNANAIIGESGYLDASNSMNSSQLYEYYGIAPGSVEIINNTGVRVYPGKDRVYVSYWANNYEFPAVYGQSKCAYTGGLYAFDNDGKLLWEKPLDSYVDNLVEQNGTIYYSTGDGKFSAVSFGLTAGLVAASLYLLFRFFLVGTVSRARTRLEENENRNGIMRFITENPGATLYDICRELAMNVGTVRYHLLILSVNHRIKADKADARYARYFSNGRHYSSEEKLVISLMKRSSVERLLKTMVETPGLPNTEISLATGLPESAVSRYLRELAAHGVVVKRRAEGGKLFYAVDEKYLQVITRQITV